MKIIYLVVLAGAIMSIACSSKTTSKNTANTVGNVATVNNAPIGNSNLLPANSSTSNFPTNSNPSMNSNISTRTSTPAEPAPEANPELLKQIEDQQRETSDIRKAANAARSEDKPKTQGKPSAAGQQPY